MAYGTVDVRFEDLTITAPIGVGSGGLPSVTNSYLGSFYVSFCSFAFKNP